MKLAPRARPRSFGFFAYFSKIGGTGFPKKDARFSKIENNPDLFSDDKEGKIM